MKLFLNSYSSLLFLCFFCNDHFKYKNLKLIVVDFFYLIEYS